MTFADIQNHIYFLTKTNSTSLPNADLTRLVKNAQNRVHSLILGADGRWEFEDSNLSDLAIGTTAIVSGQQDYSLPSTFLRINRVEVKNNSSVWSQLQPFDNTDWNGLSITQMAVIQGLPVNYDLLGSSVFLWPVPNYSQAASLKFYFQRGPLEFDYALGTFTDNSGSTASSPGFNSLYHNLIPLWASYNYAIANALPNAAGIYAEIQRLEHELLRDYSKRDKDDPQRLVASSMLFH